MVHLSKAGSNMTTLLGLFLGLVSLSSVMANPWLLGAPFVPDDQGNMSMPEPPGLDMDAHCESMVSAPADQVPWYCVCSRCKGTEGPKGELGTRGLPGRPGSPGRRGLTGFRGRPGFTGRPGIKGEKGDDGLKGDRGIEGRMGGKGERGFKGDKGERGFEGPSGEQGPRGEEGTCPDACDAAIGSPGPQGLPGSAGTNGQAGPMGPSGVKGPKGDTGTVGAPGETGSAGLKGDQGEEGECNCNDGTDGDQGLQGDKGEQGDLGETGGQGNKGDMGPKGDIGEMGFPGVPGPCAPTVQSAFSAALEVNFPPPDAPVAFSRVLYNVQQHYDANSGIYKAPVNGTYIFSYHFTVYTRILKVGLFHNFASVVKTTESADLGIASHQVILHLAMNDKVWIQVKNNQSNGMYGGSEASSTFSGFLLYPDRCDMPVFSRDFLFDSGTISTGPPPAYSWGEESTTPFPNSG